MATLADWWPACNLGDLHAASCRMPLGHSRQLLAAPRSTSTRCCPATACRRHIAVHPTLPYILTCSDDMLIKLWDWDKVRDLVCMVASMPHAEPACSSSCFEALCCRSARLARLVGGWAVVPQFGS